MAGPRITNRTLTGSRIYVRHKSYAYLAPEPMLNRKTGKVSLWHILCPVADGEFKARQELAKLLCRSEQPQGPGDFGAHFDKWRKLMLTKRGNDAPRDPARKDIWDKGTAALDSVLGVIAKGFSQFDLEQIEPGDVADFVDQWEGRRAAQVYRGHLTKFFSWCCRRRLLNANPASEIDIETPKKRKVYIKHPQFLSVKNALLKVPDHDRVMIACLMDLYYLFYQRGTDVRLLRINEVDGDGLEITPTKTENSSGITVCIPINAEARAVINRLKEIGKQRSTFLFHDEHGQPYPARKARDIFKAACDRVGVSGITLKDIRPMAASDAKKAGYTESQLKVALAHTDESTTRDYLRGREVIMSEVSLTLPK